VLKKDIFAFNPGFSLLGLLMVVNVIFDFSNLILNPSSLPSLIVWSDLLTGLLMLIIVAIITIVILLIK